MSLASCGQPASRSPAFAESTPGTQRSVSDPSEPSVPNDGSERPSFWLWLLETLQLPARPCEEGLFEFFVPASQRDDFDGRETIRFALRPIRGASGTSAEVLAAGSPLGARLLSRLKASGPFVPAVPKHQPVSVHQLAPHLFAPYRVTGGSVRLSGCSLEDHALLRYTYVVQGQAGDSAARLIHTYASPQRQPIEPALLASLRVDELAPCSARPPRVSDEQLGDWLSHGEQQVSLLAEGGRADFLVATVIWCKRAHGKLLFELGDRSAERPFDVWAQQLVDGVVRPPPFRCCVTGRESYHVIATDDGRITVAESIARCGCSGRRVLDSDLETCAVTGRRALSEFLRTCTVTGERVLADAVVRCAQCAQQVSPHALREGRCRACRSLQAVTRDDPRLARILGEYPKLDRWAHWQLAETAGVYVLTAASLFRRLLLVLDKESLAAAHVAEGFRLGRDWPQVPASQWEEFLG